MAAIRISSEIWDWVEIQRLEFFRSNSYYAGLWRSSRKLFKKTNIILDYMDQTISYVPYTNLNFFFSSISFPSFFILPTDQTRNKFYMTDFTHVLWHDTINQNWEFWWMGRRWARFTTKLQRNSQAFHCYYYKFIWIQFCLL